tara:strand:+ start:130 stop:357 length:228 start_codon:yes stop_codon:yes gene_type:complete
MNLLEKLSGHMYDQKAVEEISNKHYGIGQEDKAMTNQQINEYYDTNCNMTLAELSAITGKSIKQLKKILMENPND